MSFMDKLQLEHKFFNSLIFPLLFIRERGCLVVYSSTHFEVKAGEAIFGRQSINRIPQQQLGLRSCLSRTYFSVIINIGSRVWYNDEVDLTLLLNYDLQNCRVSITSNLELMSSSLSRIDLYH